MQSLNAIILTPPASSDLTTLAVVREELGLTDHANDSKITRWIHDASAQVVDFLGRDLALQTVEETFFVPLHQRERLSHRLLLKYWPAITVTSIVIDGIAWDSSFYIVRKPQGEIVNLDMFGRPAPWRGYQVVVTYTSGYSQADMPRAIERATVLLLRGWYAARSRDPALRSESVAGIVTQQWFDPNAGQGGYGGMPPEPAALLQPFCERFI
jgi:hypothetical protein